LADLVVASEAVAATSSRLEKISIIAALLGRLGAAEIEPTVGYLTGALRQGRVGVGWATVAGLDRSGVRDQPRERLTITDLDEAVDRLVEVTGTGSAAARAALLGDLLARSSAAEASFISCVLTGELRQGALVGLMAEAVAKAAGVPAAAVRRAHMLGGRLGPTAVLALTGGEVALAGVGLEVLRPVQPMLAATATSLDVALEAMGMASVEWKLDGARIQVHRIDDTVAVFTRNLRDVTSRLPEVVEAALSLPVRSVVLDGETLTMDVEDRPRSFQDTMARFGAEGPRQELLRPWFFDCLHVDGTDLLDQPLRARLQALEEIAPTQRIPGVVTSDPQEAARVQAEALGAGHEGVMVKAIDSVYRAGRRGQAWQKVKPVHSFDLVVLAAEWGSGRRRGWLSNLHLGARDPAGGFVMVGKTFKGLTDVVLAWQTAQFLERETSRSGHHDEVVHVRPELVVEVALDGVQRSVRYPGGVALRFARVVRYRNDKDPDQADTIDSLRAMLPGRP